MDKTIKLNNWSVVYPNKDPYTPPEFAKPSLHGTVKNHPKLGKNVKLTTSTVIDAKGRLVRTYSGHTYKLGKPDHNYLMWLKMSGIKLDEKQPIKI